MIETKEEILKRNVESIAKCKVKYNVTEKGILNAMEEYAEQQCDLIRDLYTKPTIQLKPLEDLWREENPRDKFTIPDMTAFYKWIRIKILGK